LNKIQPSTKGVAPTLGSNVFVAHNALIRGGVSLGSNSSVWYKGSVESDDLQPIVIGSNVHLKDHSKAQSTATSPLTIGDAVEIGPHVKLTGCTLQGHNFVGPFSQVGEGAVLEAGAVLAPFSIVPAGTKVGADELWAGQPAIKVRALSTTEIAVTRASIQRTSVLAQEHGVESNKSIGEVLDEADQHFVGQLEHPLEKDRPIPL
jgi:carbonic anhydrase/acetyltransferase-like protein (isoleucine patch superfamily)